MVTFCAVFYLYALNLQLFLLESFDFGEHSSKSVQLTSAFLGISKRLEKSFGRHSAQMCAVAMVAVMALHILGNLRQKAALAKLLLVAPSHVARGAGDRHDGRGENW